MGDELLVIREFEATFTPDEIYEMFHPYRGEGLYPSDRFASGMNNIFRLIRNLTQQNAPPNPQHILALPAFTSYSPDYRDVVLERLVPLINRCLIIIFPQYDPDPVTHQSRRGARYTLDPTRVWVAVGPYRVIMRERTFDDRVELCISDVQEAKDMDIGTNLGLAHSLRDAHSRLNALDGRQRPREQYNYTGNENKWKQFAAAASRGHMHTCLSGWTIIDVTLPKRGEYVIIGKGYPYNGPALFFSIVLEYPVVSAYKIANQLTYRTHIEVIASNKRPAEVLRALDLEFNRSYSAPPAHPVGGRPWQTADVQEVYNYIIQQGRSRKITTHEYGWSMDRERQIEHTGWGVYRSGHEIKLIFRQDDRTGDICAYEWTSGPLTRPSLGFIAEGGAASALIEALDEEFRQD